MRQLGQREAEEIAAGQQAEVARLKLELRRQRRRQGGRDRTHQCRQEVGEGECEEHRRAARRPVRMPLMAGAGLRRRWRPLPARTGGRARSPDRATPRHRAAGEPQHVRLGDRLAVRVCGLRIEPRRRGRAAARGSCGRGFVDGVACQLLARRGAPGPHPCLGLRRAVGGRVGHGEGRAAGLAAGHVDRDAFGERKRQCARCAIGLAGQQRDQSGVRDGHFAPVESGAAGGKGQGAQRETRQCGDGTDEAWEVRLSSRVKMRARRPITYGASREVATSGTKIIGTCPSLP